MGKNNLILGTGRGKLGDIVFYRTGGEQRFRTRVRPTNPRSNAQLLQRCVVSTAVKLYSEIITVADHAFQNFDGKLKNHQRYMRLNIKLLRNMALSNIVSWSPIEFKDTNLGNYVGKDGEYNVVNPLYVSEGDLAQIVYEFKNGATGNLIPAIGYSYAQENYKYEDITYQDMCDFLSVDPGDQVTMIAFIGEPDNAIIEHTIIGRVVMMPKNGDMSEKFFGNKEQRNPEDYGQVTINVSPLNDTTTTPSIQSVGNIYPTAMIKAYAVIRSKFENNKWKRSTQQIVVKSTAQNTATLESAMATYLKASTSSEYLNQAVPDDWPQLIYPTKEANAELEDTREVPTRTRRTRRQEE